MKKYQPSKLQILIMACFPMTYSNADADALVLLDSESTHPEIRSEVKRNDTSRIYLPQGAIWATRDVSRLTPVFNLTTTDRAELDKNSLTSDVSFTVSTNYSYYVKKWQLDIFDGRDRGLSQPIHSQTGTELSNNGTLSWDGSSTIPLVSGNQLLYRLKMWDAKGNMDVTTLGVIDLVKAPPKKEAENGLSDTTVTVDKLTNSGQKKVADFGRAELMRHNIPTNSGMVKLMGTGLIGVDTIDIGDDQYDIHDGKLYVEKYLPVGEYTFPVKVAYKNGQQEAYSLGTAMPESYYSQTGLADIYAGRNYVSGNDDILAVNDKYQGDIYNSGRLAYFGEGKFGEHWRLTTAFDSRDQPLKDIFKNPFAATDTTVFDILDDDDELYYGNYGDNANIEKVVNTKGKFYLDAQYDKSSLLWGSYNTGVTGTDTEQYNRSLYGFRGNYRTQETTRFGDDRLNVMGFTSQADTLSAHDEFLGTGGSLYLLNNSEVVPGSDKVYVKVTDPKTGLTIKQVPLQSGRDYEINAYQGRIILNRPLSEITDVSSSGDVITDTPGGDYKNYLTVDYEYVPDTAETLKNMTKGGRVKGWVNDNIGLGATAVNESKDSHDYTLYGSDLTLRATEGTWLKAEFGHSKGTQSDSNFVSLDGGLSFTPITSMADDREGDSVQVTGVANLHDLMPDTFGAVGNDVSFWYKDKDAEYSNASQFDNVGQLSWGGEMRLQIDDETQVVSSVKNITEEDENGVTTTDSQEFNIEAQKKLTDHVKVALAGQHIQELNNDDQMGTGDLLGARVEYWFNDDDYAYLRGQQTVHASEHYDNNDSATIGGQVVVYEDWTLGADYTVGDRGNSADASVTYDVTDDYSTYVTYGKDGYEDQNTLTVGQKYNATEALDLYQENQFVDENNGKGRIDSFGFDYDLDDDVTFGMAYQQGTIDYTDQSDVERKAVSVYTTLDQDNYQLTNKLEYRTDKGDDDIHQFATINDYVWHMTEEYTFYGKVNYSQSRNVDTDDVVERFLESNIGLAYRPVYNDKLNILTRYTYLIDYDALNDDDDIQDEKSHIIESEFIYSLTPRVDVGSKFAYKKKHEVYTRDSGETLPVDSKIYLTGLTLSYNVMNDWNVTGEYHLKQDSVNQQTEHGALVSLEKEVGKNMKVGVGYNFSSFNDDLVHDDDYDAKGFFINVVGKF